MAGGYRLLVVHGYQYPHLRGVDGVGGVLLWINVCRRFAVPSVEYLDCHAGTGASAGLFNDEVGTHIVAYIDCAHVVGGRQVEIDTRTRSEAQGPPLSPAATVT